MKLEEAPLTAFDALDPKILPDHRLITMFLDWAVVRGLLDGYYLVLYHQTGTHQGVPTHRSQLPDELNPKADHLIRQHVRAYQAGQRASIYEVHHLDDGHQIYITSISRIYDIDLGLLILMTPYEISREELDQFIRYTETTISIRKQAIASTLNPPFVDLALHGAVQLDLEVGNTVAKSIEANRTHVLRFSPAEATFDTAFSTSGEKWTISQSDPLLAQHSRAAEPFYFQDVLALQGRSEFNRSALREHLVKSGCRSALIFNVQHETEQFATILCLFARPHAVSMTEVAITRRLQTILAEYYRLGFERQRSAQASFEADDVEKKARQALLIADIMHDAADDLLAAKSAIDGLRPRTDDERASWEGAKKNLKQLVATARMFRYLFNESGSYHLKVEKAFATGKDYYSDTSVRDIFESIEKKYRSDLEVHKITLSMQVPPRLSIRCMEVSISRAIDNCVKNSIKHLRDKSHVKRAVTLQAKEVLTGGQVYVELSVLDNGSGIEPSILPKIRKPFVSYSGGMGLGLSIVNTVCEIHNGRMEVSSDWGAWTRVTMRFPQSGVQRKEA